MQQLICARLNRKSGIWRVDGIGAIRPSRTLGSRLTYHFSQIYNDSIGDAYKCAASTGETYPLKAHSSWLKVFTPGSLWEKGAKIRSPLPVSQFFEVDTSECIYTFPDEVSKFVPLKTLLPPSHLNFGDNHKPLSQTKFALLRIKNFTSPHTDWLIIPTAELFRFYVGASSNLITRALTATTDEIIDTEATNLVDGVLTIYDITGDLSKREAYHFGRTKTGPHAMETYYGPHKYLSNAAIRNSQESLHIDCRFPFAGRTTLQVTGKSIQLRRTDTNRAEWAVLVTQIRHCSYPIGIHHVERICTGVLNDGSGRGGIGGRRPPRPRKTDLEDPIEINDGQADPTRGILIAQNPVLPSDPTHYISQNTIIVGREDFDAIRARLVNTPPSGHTFEKGAGAANGSGNQKVEIEDVSEDSYRDIRHFIEMLKELRVKAKDDEWKITTLGYEKDERKLVGEDIITTFPSMQGRFSWYLMSDDRRRYAVWVQIEIEKKFIYLIEMELREGEPGRSILAFTTKQSSDAPIECTQEEFKNLLTLTAIHNGWPPERADWKEHATKATDLFNKFKFTRINHPYHASPKKTESDENQKKGEKKNETAVKLPEKKANEKTATADKSKGEVRKAQVLAEDWADFIHKSLLNSFEVF